MDDYDGWWVRGDGSGIESWAWGFRFNPARFINSSGTGDGHALDCTDYYSTGSGDMFDLVQEGKNPKNFREG